MSVLGQTCDEKCAAYDSCVEAGTADCSAAETQCSTCMNSEQQGFNQPAQSYGQLMGALADPWDVVRYRRPRSVPVIRWRDFREPFPRWSRLPAERVNMQWNPMPENCYLAASREFQARLHVALGLLDRGDFQGYLSIVRAASAELGRQERQCNQIDVDGMAIPFMGDTKTFTGKDWAMLFGLLVLVVVLVYLLWARRR